MRKLSSVLKRASTAGMVLLLLLLVLRTMLPRQPSPVPHKPMTNISERPLPRRNADTLTLMYAAQAQMPGGVHTKWWREHVLKTLGIRNTQLTINVPQHISFQEWDDYNLMKLPTFDLLPNFRNPCWKESYRPKMICPNVKTLQTDNELTKRYPVDYLRCLPYFYMVGQPKCGTTDIYVRLNKHPDVVAPNLKESFWMERYRFSSGCSSINTYLDFQADSSHRINADFIQNQTGHRYHHKITGDGTVDLMWDNSLWPLLPGNKGCREPCVTNADIIHHLYPQAKIIIAFRNPVERVYSDFLFEATWLHYNISRTIFHREVMEEINKFQTCLKTNTPRACVYNGSHENSFNTKVRLRQGLYSIHLTDWLRVFPRQQIHIIKFEDYVRNTEHEMKALFKFLNIRDLNDKEMKRILNVRVSNTRKKRARAVGEMSNDTKNVLTKFYKQYNTDLAAMLDDKRFLWDT